jgi:hypothetical protein
MNLLLSPSVTYAVGNSAGMAHQPVLKNSKMYTVSHQAVANIAKIAT